MESFQDTLVVLEETRDPESMSRVLAHQLDGLVIPPVGEKLTKAFAEISQLAQSTKRCQR